MLSSATSRSVFGNTASVGSSINSQSYSQTPFPAHGSYQVLPTSPGGTQPSFFNRPNLTFKSTSTAALLVFLCLAFLILVTGVLDPTAKYTEIARRINSAQQSINQQNSPILTPQQRSASGIIPSSQLPRSPSGLPIANYAIVIDAGSSGSRVYVYQYKVPEALSVAGAKEVFARITDPSSDLLHIAVAEDDQHRMIIRKESPGLSAYADHPTRAFDSVQKLLQFAAEHIPASLHSRTPVYVLATAGLRLVPEEKRNAILAAVRAGLRAQYDKGGFLFESDEQADVITGEQEGLYGWLALNYVLNRFGDLNETYATGGLDPHTYQVLPPPQPHAWFTTDHQGNPVNPSGTATNTNTGSTGSGSGVSHGWGGHVSLPRTVALVELGGGSAQIAFEADSNDDDTMSTSGSGSNDNEKSVKKNEYPSDYVFSVNLDLTSCDDPTVERITIQEDIRRRQAEHGSTTITTSSSSSPSSSSSSSISGNTPTSLSLVTAGGNNNGAVLVPAADISTKSNKQVVLDRRGKGLGRGGHRYSVYSASFLGYGANSARERYVKRLIEGREGTVIKDPCLLKHQYQVVSIKDTWGKGWPRKTDLPSSPSKPTPSGTATTTTTTTASSTIVNGAPMSSLKPGETILEGIGHWEQCKNDLQAILDKDKPCRYNCPFGGIYQPVLSKDILDQQFYAFSEYWYTTRDVLSLPPESFTADQFAKASKDLCSADISDFHRVFEMFKQNKFNKNANEDRVRQQCFKSAWLDVILFDGHGFPRNLPAKSILPVSSIGDTEVQWTLGAVLTLITGRIKSDRSYCRRISKDDGLSDIKMKIRNDIALELDKSNDNVNGNGQSQGQGVLANKSKLNKLPAVDDKYKHRNYAPEASSESYHHETNIHVPQPGTQPIPVFVIIVALLLFLLGVKAFYGPVIEPVSSKASWRNVRNSVADRV